MQKKTIKPTLSDLEKEKNNLYVNANNPKRLKQVIEYLDWIYYGINKIPYLSAIK